MMRLDSAAERKSGLRAKVGTDRIKRILERFKGASERADWEISSERIHYRMAEIASRLPPAGSGDDVLVDIGSTVFWIPVYQEILGYGNITILCKPWGSYFELFESRGLFRNVNLRIVECDAEWPAYPLPDEHASCVVCLDLLEHLAGDPMNIFSEANRILKANGSLVIGTPNVSHYGNLEKAVQGYHPFNWSPFTETYADRHNREYTPGEISYLFEKAGFHVSELTTFRNAPTENAHPLVRLFYFCARLRCKSTLPLGLLHCNILATGIKEGGILERYPGNLYELRGFGSVNFNKTGLPEGLGMEKGGKAILLVRSAPTEISGDSRVTVVIHSLSLEPIDILVDLFVSGEWRAGQKAAGLLGARESDIGIDISGKLPEQCSAYFSVKAVPAGQTWQSSLVDLKLPYMRCKP